MFRHVHGVAELKTSTPRLCWSIGALLSVALLLSGAARAAEQVVEIATRPGQQVRALLIKPGKPVGSVILLAGGHGNLAISPSGEIGWGRNNQLVRSRAAYADAGFATLLPDIAADLKQGDGGRPRYRWSEEFARDIGALVAHLRAVAPPVYLVGTSRAALSVANAAVRLSGTQRPDALVITSGMLMHVAGHQPSVQRDVPRLERITQPTLLVSHADDPCAFTLATSAGRFKALLKRAARVDIVLIRGGPEGPDDQCSAFGHHGFFGQDEEVVAAITRWVKNLR
jgi:hypothetical protein